MSKEQNACKKCSDPEFVQKQIAAQPTDAETDQ